MLQRESVAAMLATLRDELGPFEVEVASGLRPRRQPAGSARIVAGAETVGWVTGSSSRAVAAIIGTLLEAELAQRATRAEALARYRELTLLYRVAETLPRHVDFEGIAHTATREAHDFFKADTAMLYVFRNHRLGAVSRAGPGGLLPADDLCRAVARDGIPRLVDASDEARVPESGGAVIAVPLALGPSTATPDPDDVSLGVLRLWSARGGAWSAGDLKLVGTLAHHAAALLHNALLRVEAERASDAKSAFLAHMSHELRSPLSAIIGYAEILEEDLHEPASKQDVQRILSASRHLLELINDVLSLSRVESGTLELEREPVDIEALIRAVVDVSLPAAQSNATVLVAEVAHDVPAITTDRKKLRQVVQNLVSNACKFTTDGEVRVRAWMEQGELVIAVSDTGIGMTAEQVACAFDPFVQADATIAGRFGGTGLGLAISKRLLEALGGFIEVDSSFGVGTSFRITLPVADGWR